MRQRKYNLPAHVCWDVTCDLYHANFVIDKKRYSVKKKTVKEAMEYVATTYYNTGKWSLTRMQAYLAGYVQYENLDKPETRRIDSKLKVVIETEPNNNVVEMLMKVAKSYSHNKDDVSLRYKAETTAKFLQCLKGRTDGIKPDLSYSNDLGGFILTFSQNIKDGEIVFIINRHKAKIEVNKIENTKKTRVGLKLYSIKEFYAQFIRIYPAKGFLQYLINRVCYYTNKNVIKNELTIDEMKDILCDL